MEVGRLLSALQSDDYQKENPPFRTPRPQFVSENQSVHTALGEENSPGFRNQVSDIPLYLTLRFVLSGPIITYSLSELKSEGLLASSVGRARYSGSPAVSLSLTLGVVIIKKVNKLKNTIFTFGNYNSDELFNCIREKAAGSLLRVPSCLEDINVSSIFPAVSCWKRRRQAPVGLSLPHTGGGSLPALLGHQSPGCGTVWAND